VDGVEWIIFCALTDISMLSSVFMLPSAFDRFPDGVAAAKGIAAAAFVRVP